MNALLICLFLFLRWDFITLFQTSAFRSLCLLDELYIISNVLLLTLNYYVLLQSVFSKDTLRDIYRDTKLNNSDS